MNLREKHILITQLRLHDYAGSETVTLELAEYFSSQGALVTIATNSFGAPIQEEFDKIPRIRLFNFRSDDLNEYIKENPVDIAWIHHQLIPLELIINPGDTRFIFHHMSPYAKIEAPVFWRLEEALADIILCNSNETLQAFYSQGYFENSNSQIKVFNNPAPKKFKINKHNISNKLTSLLIVSNHVPDELSVAVEMLKDQGIKVDMFGAHQDTYKRLSPEDFKGYDAVVSIGKTVQYALTAQLPVYCYDRFGGPGYLSDKNFQLAEGLNFSGRGFDTKTGDRIATELIEGFTEALTFTGDLPVKSDYFILEKRLEDELVEVYKFQHKKVTIHPLDIENYNSAIELILQNLPGSAHQNERESFARKHAHEYKMELERRVDMYSHQIEEYHRTVGILHEQLNSVTSSTSFRVGNFIAWPLRKIKDFSSSQASQSEPQKPKSIELERFYGPIEILDKNPLKISIILKNAAGPSSSAFIRLFSPLTLSSSYKLTVLDGDNYRSIKPDVDICIIQRVALASFADAEELKGILDKNNTLLITDTDDAFCEIDPVHPEYDELKSRSDALTYLIENANLNLFSTKRLLKIYTDLTHISNGIVIRNALDERLWPRWRGDDINITSENSLQIVYMGTPTHGADFDVVEDVFDALNKKYPGEFTLTVIGISRDIENKDWLKVIYPENGIYPEFTNWFANEGPFDIGIGPLIESEFNSNKSDIKCLDYLANGIKPLVSNVEAYKNTELDDFVVRINNTTEEWFNSLEYEIKNKKTTRKTARERIIKGYEYLRSNRSISQTANELDMQISALIDRSI